MRIICAAAAALCLHVALAAAQPLPGTGDNAAGVPFTPVCRPLEAMIGRVVSAVAPEEIRRTDYDGGIAAELLARINAEPPESDMAGDHLTLLEREGWDALVAVSSGGCFAGGARLGREVVQRIFGERW